MQGLAGHDPDDRSLCAIVSSETCGGARTPSPRMLHSAQAGPDGLVFPIFMDTSNVNIKVLAKAETPVISPVMSPNDLSVALKEKYKQYRNLKKT